MLDIFLSQIKSASTPFPSGGGTFVLLLLVLPAGLHEAGEEVEEGGPDVGAAQAVDVEVEGEVQQLQVVGNGPVHPVG